MSDINIKSTTVEKGIDLLKDFIGKVIGPSADEFGQMLSDNIKARRLKNQLHNFEKVKKIVDEKGIDVKEVNMKVLFPYLEGTALEEDEDLQNLWANLLVNYIDIDSTLITTVYPSILGQLSSEEVKILRHVYNSDKDAVYLRGDHAPKWIVSSAVDNLQRLGLILRHPSDNKVYYMGSVYVITSFGVGFMNAVEPINRKKKTNFI